MLQTRLIRPCFVILFAGLLAFATSGPAGAQENVSQGYPTAKPKPVNPFTVSGVAVDASADNAAAARPLAIADGQRRAFARLMRRLTLPEDQGRLPRPSEALLNQTVAGFEIDEERTSATRYIGKITVNFRADAIRRLLQDAKLPYSETASRPALLIPVWQAPSGEKLWEADNPWRDAWQNRPDMDGLVPLSIAPPSDTAPPLDRLLANPEELRGFARQQGYEDVLMVSATPKQQTPGDIRIEIYPYHTGPGEFLDRLETFTTSGGTQEEALLSGAVELSRRIEARWKAGTVIDPDKQGQLSAAALFTSLAEWNKLRMALAAVPIVRKVEVQRLSHRDAQLLIAFYGEPNQLAVALAQRDVQLEQKGGFWELRGRQP